MAKRRGHGEGGVYRRKSDGRWVAVVDAGYVDGRRRRVSSYHDTRKAAADNLPELRKRARSVAAEKAEIKSVEQFLDHWIETTVTKTRAPKTVESYRDAIRLHIVPEIGRKRLVTLSRPDVQRMLDAVARKKQAGPRTVENVRAVFRAALNDGRKWGMIDTNPAEHTTIEKVPDSERKALTVDQARALLLEVHEDRFEALYILAAVYGLRRGEILGLRWDDVDTEQWEIRIRQQVIVVDKKPTITPLKTRRSRRTLPLLGFVEQAFDRRRDAQREDHLLAGDAWQEHGLVFTSMVGTPYQPANLHKRWRRHLENADLPIVPFHSLRHTAASFLVALNVHPRVAMEILGHTNIKTTMEVYSHAQQDGMREALESVANVLSGGGDGNS